PLIIFGLETILLMVLLFNSAIVSNLAPTASGVPRSQGNTPVLVPLSKYWIPMPDGNGSIGLTVRAMISIIKSAQQDQRVQMERGMSTKLSLVQIIPGYSSSTMCLSRP